METLHNLLLQSKSLLHVSSTGAGPRLQQALWDNPGASQYLVGFFTPYARTQLHSFLGHSPDESYVHEDVAYDMAMASYIRAAEHQVESGAEGNPVGLGITAAVASERMPRGPQKAHIVVITRDTIRNQTFYLDKAVGKEARLEHDRAIATVALGLLGDVLEGTLGNHPVSATKAFERFYEYPIFHTNGTRRKPSERESAIYLPATLNPIHDGHRAMCRAAEDYYSPGVPGRIKAMYLVSSASPHKGTLSVQDMLFKAGMLRAERWRRESRAVEFTHAEPLFLDKARKRPGSVFIIGADTMARMLDPQWGPSIEPMLNEIKNLGVEFLVMGRVIDGKWTTCRDVKVPYLHQNLFTPIEGRVDISSTAIREAQSA